MKAGISPSSRWCWEPGTWSPLTTMRTAAMRPPCLPAPVLPPLRWSLTSAVRQKRGERWIKRRFWPLIVFCQKHIFTDRPLRSLYSQVRLPRVHRFSGWKGPLWHESWNWEVAKGEIQGIMSVFCPFLNKNPFNPLKPPFSFSLLSQKVTFDAGPQLQFLFHSDSSNNEWGYKFTVTALGLPDITISWISDLQLLVARLMGRLASRTLALKSPHGETVVQSLFIKNHTVCYLSYHVCCDHLRYF